VVTNYVSSGSSVVYFTNPSKHVPADVVRIDNGNDDWVLIRLGESVGGSGFIIDSIIDTNLAASDTFTTADSTCKTTLASVPFGSGKRKALNYLPVTLFNFFQTHRDTLAKTWEEMSVSSLADTSLETLGMKSVIQTARKLNYSIHSQYNSLRVASSSGEFAVFGGLPHFFDPAIRTFAETTGSTERYNKLKSADSYGINTVGSGTAVTLSMLETHAKRQGQYGSKDKTAFVSPDFFSKVKEAVYGDVSLERSVYGSVNPEYVDPWSVPYMDLGYCKYSFVVDYDLNTLPMLVKDSVSTSTTNATDTSNWMVTVDPDHTKLIPAIIDNVGVDTLGIRPLPKDDINSVRKSEMESTGTYTLQIDDPRTGGYFGITGTGS